MIKSPWILQQEKNNRTRAIVRLVVCITLIAAVMGINSFYHGSPSMVPAGVNVDNLRGEAQRQAAEVIR